MPKIEKLEIVYNGLIEVQMGSNIMKIMDYAFTKFDNVGEICGFIKSKLDKYHGDKDSHWNVFVFKNQDFSYRNRYKQGYFISFNVTQRIILEMRDYHVAIFLGIE